MRAKSIDTDPARALFSRHRPSESEKHPSARTRQGLYSAGTGPVRAKSIYTDPARALFSRHRPSESEKHRYGPGKGSIQPAPAQGERKASIRTRQGLYSAGTGPVRAKRIHTDPARALFSQHRPSESEKHPYGPRQGLYSASTGPVRAKIIHTDPDKGSIQPAPAQ